MRDKNSYIKTISAKKAGFLVLQNLIVALLYLFTGRLGLYLAIPPGYATLIWPPSGIALGAVNTMGARVLPGIGLGSFLVNLWVASLNDNLVNPEIAIALAAIIAAGAVIQAYIGDRLVKKIVRDSLDLSSFKSVIKYFIVGGPIGCVINATSSVTALFVFGAIDGSSMVQSWLTWWSGDTLGVLAATPIILILLAKPRNLWKKRMKLVALPVLVTLLLVVVSFEYILKADRLKIKAAFDVETNLITEDLKLGIQRYSRALATLSAFHSVQRDNFNRTNYKLFVDKILPDYPGISAISWNPVIKNTERSKFERQMSSEMKMAFGITQKGPRGELVAAKERNQYVVVSYIEPLKANIKVVGFDIASDSLRLDAIKKTNRKLSTVATEFIQLVQSENPDNEIGFLIISPVYDQFISDDPAKILIEGYFVAIVKVEEMVRAILGNHFKNNKVSLKIKDQKGKLIFSHGNSNLEYKRFVNLEKVIKIEPIDNNFWTLNLAPTDRFFAGVSQVQAWYVLVGGFLLSGLLGGFLLILAGRNERLTVEIENSTQSLYAVKKANSKLRILSDSNKILNSSLDLDVTLHSIESLSGHEFSDLTTIDLMVGNEVQRGELLEKILEAGKSQLYVDVSDDFIRSIVRDEEHYKTFKKLGLKSAIIVPMMIRGESIGIISFYSIRADRHFDSDDLAFAEEIASRAAIAIDNSRLYQASQEASIAKNTFIANMSHEIRTPLGAVIGFSELLADESVDKDKKATFVAAVRRNGNLLAKIINDILDIAKVESGVLHIEPVEFSFEKIVADCKLLLEPRAKEKGIELRFEISDSVPAVVKTDPHRLLQILINIISNAIKFTTDGVVSISIDLKDQSDGPILIEFSVTDTGIGISDDQIDKLFVPFSQADNRAKREYGGTGLGLSLSKRLAKLLGGDVKLTSTEFQKGSTFTITIDSGLTLSQIHADTPLPVDISNKSITHKLTGLRMLVAEDSLDNQTLITEMLAPSGVNLKIVSNGEEAVELAMNNTYDVLLMDLQMPVMDGYEATTKLRKNGYSGKIIALTAHARPEDKQRTAQVGFNGHLIKPIDRNALIEVLESC